VGPLVNSLLSGPDIFKNSKTIDEYLPMGGMMGILAGRLDIPLTVAITVQQYIFI
jgi:hypothetical protein